MVAVWCDENTNNQLRSVLGQIYPSEVTRKYTFYERDRLVKSVLRQFEHDCREICPVFDQLFHSCLYTGSAYEALQVNDPVEFDVDVVLKFPDGHKNEVHFEESNNPSGHCTAKIRKTEQSLPHLDPYSEFCNRNGFFIPEKLHSWLQSLITDVIFSRNFKKPYGIKEIRESEGGTALTLKLLHGSVWLSVDLVPVFAVNLSNRLPKVKLYKKLVSGKQMCNFLLVPKPLKHASFYHLFMQQQSRLWRIHYNEAEEDFLYDRHCLKPVIKLVKRLRDIEGWSIPSYFIKTVAFWILTENLSSGYFYDINLGRVFLQLLDRLQKCLDDQYLGDIFYPDFNLLHGMESEVLEDASERIGIIIEDLQDNPQCAFNFFRRSGACKAITSQPSQASSVDRKALQQQSSKYPSWLCFSGRFLSFL